MAWILEIISKRYIIKSGKFFTTTLQKFKLQLNREVQWPNTNNSFWYQTDHISQSVYITILPKQSHSINITPTCKEFWTNSTYNINTSWELCLQFSSATVHYYSTHHCSCKIQLTSWNSLENFKKKKMTLSRDFGVQNLNFLRSCRLCMTRSWDKFFSCPQEDRGKTHSSAKMSNYCIKIFQLFWLHLQFFSLFNIISII